MKNRAVLVALACVGLAAVAIAQSAKPLSSLTVSLTPDAGVVATITDAVRVVGADSGAVQVSGTVDLSSASLGSLGTAKCTYGDATRLSLPTTATAITSAISGRTAVTLINSSSGGSGARIVCRMGGAPTCSAPGTGLSLFPSGGSVRFAVSEATSIQCRSCGASPADFEYLEESCTVP